MKYYPMFLNINNSDALVIGGGKVAYRKTRQLLSAGALITLVSKSVISEFENLKGIEFNIRQAKPSDIKETYRLIIIATNDSKVNSDLASICKKKNILFNRADTEIDNGFITGATINKEPISVAITSGVPTITKLIKDITYETITDEMILLTDLLKEVRIKHKDSAEGKRIMMEYSTLSTLARIKAEGFEKIKQEVISCLSC